MIKLKETIVTKINIFFVIEYVQGGELFVKVAKAKLKKDLLRKNTIFFVMEYDIYSIWLLKLMTDLNKQVPKMTFLKPKR